MHNIVQNDICAALTNRHCLNLFHIEFKYLINEV